MALLAVVTGASRGFGRSLAIRLAASAHARGVAVTWVRGGTRVGGGEGGVAVVVTTLSSPAQVLMARDAGGLAATSAAVKAVAPASGVIEQCVDFSDLPSITHAWQQAVRAAKASRSASDVGAAATAGSGAAAPAFAGALLVHNSGSLGGIGLARTAAVKASREPEVTSGELDGLRKAIDRCVRQPQALQRHTIAPLVVGRLPPPTPLAAMLRLSCGSPVSSWPWRTIPHWSHLWRQPAPAPLRHRAASSTCLRWQR